MSANELNQPDDILCPCSGTKRSTIQRMFEQGLSVEEISQRSGALSGCGGCEWDIAEFVEILSKKSI